jgi:hypothetical protein
MVTPTTLSTSFTQGQPGHLAAFNTVTAAVNALTAAASVDVREYGAVGNGTTDDAAAINNAAVAAAAAGARLFARGTFKIGSAVTLNCECDMSSATFNYTGTTGTAITVGIAGSATFRRVARLPKVVATAKTATGWSQVAGTVGVLIQNCYNVDMFVPYIQSFETGLEIYGTTSNGSAYCNVTLGHLDNNKRNLYFTADSTGWANQNTFYGGRLSHNSAEGTVVSGTRHVLIDTTTSKVNNNNFFGTSIESPNTVEYHLDCGGNDNYWWGCRWENTGTGARVNWQASSIGNVIAHGFASHTIVETKGATTANQILTRARSRMVGDGAALSLAVLALENTSSSTAAALRVMEAGAESAGTDQTTGWAVELSAQKFRGKRAADTNERTILDLVNGRIYFAAGNVTPVCYIGNIGTSIGVVGGNLCFSTDNTLDIGASSLRPRYIRAGTAVQTAVFTTAGRPAAATAGAGAMIFDSTLGKPVWVNAAASGYVDATGASV